uniref:Ig-like domain-containing protein n=1 Tax=Macrostomum lignano TaxID=282301 RepID=A0A1I8FMF3_9PLAT
HRHVPASASSPAAVGAWIAAPAHRDCRPTLPRFSSHSRTHPWSCRPPASRRVHTSDVDASYPYASDTVAQPAAALTIQDIYLRSEETGRTWALLSSGKLFLRQRRNLSEGRPALSVCLLPRRSSSRGGGSLALTLEQQKKILEAAKKKKCQCQVFAMDYLKRGTCLYLCSAYKLEMYQRENYLFILANRALDVFVNSRSRLKTWPMAMLLWQNHVKPRPELQFVGKSSRPPSKSDSFYYGVYTTQAVQLMAHASVPGSLCADSTWTCRQGPRTSLATANTNDKAPISDKMKVRGKIVTSDFLAEFKWQQTGSRIEVRISDSHQKTKGSFDTRFAIEDNCTTAFMRVFYRDLTCPQTIVALISSIFLLCLAGLLSIFVGLLRFYQRGAAAAAARGSAQQRRPPELRGLGRHTPAVTGPGRHPQPLWRAALGKRQGAELAQREFHFFSRPSCRAVPPASSAARQVHAGFSRLDSTQLTTGTPPQSVVPLHSTSTTFGNCGIGCRLSAASCCQNDEPIFVRLTPRSRPPRRAVSPADEERELLAASPNFQTRRMVFEAPPGHKRKARGEVVADESTALLHLHHQGLGNAWQSATDDAHMTATRSRNRFDSVDPAIRHTPSSGERLTRGGADFFAVFGPPCGQLALRPGPADRSSPPTWKRRTRRRSENARSAAGSSAPESRGPRSDDGVMETRRLARPGGRGAVTARPATDCRFKEEEARATSRRPSRPRRRPPNSAQASREAGRSRGCGSASSAVPRRPLRRRPRAEAERQRRDARGRQKGVEGRPVRLSVRSASSSGRLLLEPLATPTPWRVAAMEAVGLLD